jgi:predicted RNA-binding protein with PIN domain
VTFLIDGYNLMYAVGYASKGMPAGDLARGRARLLDWIADLRGDRTDAVRVVFDGVAGKKSKEGVHRGLAVRYSHKKTADDVIEALIAAEPKPQQLAVVSNDNRLRDAAKRRRCAVYSSDAFVDWLMKPALVPVAPAAAPDPDAPTADEMAAWLDVFSRPPPKKPRS